MSRNAHPPEISGYKSNRWAAEIAKAIQRSASVAKEAGVDFEHLATWITIVSERTRLSPEVIGTSIQAMLARLHQMRASGYSDDGTSTNMIETSMQTINKSLGTNLSLFEEGTNKWRDAQLVFEDIASVWQKMDDMQRAYLTTMIAGTRQQDRFINLMDSMSDKSNGMSRYQELLTVAMTSAGATMTKYERWTKGVTAAQNNLKASFEALYNAMGATGKLKGFYDTMSGLLGLFTDGSVGSGLGISAAIAGITGITLAIIKLVSVIKSLGKPLLSGGLGTLVKGMSLTKIIGLVSAIAVGGTLISGMLKPKNEEKEVRELSVIQNDMEEHTASTRRYSKAMSSLIGDFKELESEIGGSVIMGTKYETLVQALISSAPHLERKLKTSAGTYVALSEAIKVATDNQETFLANSKAAGQRLAEEALVSAAKSMSSSYQKIDELEKLYTRKGFIQDILYEKDGQMQQWANDLLNDKDFKFSSEYDPRDKDFMSMQRYAGMAGIDNFHLEKRWGGWFIPEEIKSKLQDSIKFVDDNWYTLAASIEEAKTALVKSTSEFESAIAMSLSSMELPEGIDGIGKDYFTSFINDAITSNAHLIESGQSYEFSKAVGVALYQMSVDATKYMEDPDYRTEIRGNFLESLFANMFDDRGLSAEILGYLKGSSMTDDVYEAYRRYVTFLGEQIAKDKLKSSYESGKLDDFVAQGSLDSLVSEKLDRINEKHKTSFTADSFRFMADESGKYSEIVIHNIARIIDKVTNETINVDEFIDAMVRKDEEALNNLVTAEEKASAVQAIIGDSYREYLASQLAGETFIKELTEIQALLKTSENPIKDIGTYFTQMSTLSLSAMLKLYPSLSVLARETKTSEEATVLLTEAFAEAAENASKLKSAISGATSSMDVYSSMADVQNKIKSGEKIGFGDISDMLGTNPALIKLLAKENAEEWGNIVSIEMVAQREKIKDNLKSTIRADKDIMEALGLGTDPENIDSEALETAVDGMVTAYTEAIDASFSEKLEEKNPFLDYINNAIAEVNAERVNEMFEENGLADQFSALQASLSESGTDGFKSIIDRWSGETGTTGSAIFAIMSEMEGFKELLIDIANGSINAAEAQERLNAVQKKSNLARLNKQHEEFAGYLSDMKKGGKDAAKAYTTVVGKAKDLNKAQFSLNQAMADGDKESQSYQENIKTVADYLGMGIEDVENFALAQRLLSQETAATEENLSYMLNSLIGVSGISINTGAITDPISQIGPVAADAQLTVDALRAAILAMNGATISATRDANGNLRYSVKLPNAGRSSGGGASRKSSGGGGGGGSKEKSAVESLLEGYDEQSKLFDLTREIIQMNQALHESRNELTAVNTLLQQEYDYVADQDKIDRQHLATIKEKIAAGGQSAEDMEKLKEAHAEYSKKIVQNTTDLEALQRQITENKNAIRQAEIDLRTLLHDTYMASVELRKEMLSNRQDMEEQVLETIRERYEKEWELLKEDLDRKKDALNEEKRLINERLQERKKAAEQEDKYKQLADLEAQLARIAADPTRAKDQLALQKQIAKLREDLSWQIAEDEVKAQEKSIEQQVESIDNYSEFMQKYYDDLLEHPIRLAQEMLRVFQDADAELVAWATASVANFATMTAEQQQVTIDRVHQLSYMTTEEMSRWMSDNVIGFAELTEQEQVALIESVKNMAQQGNAAVVDWLMANNEEFRNATDTQKLTMIQSWEETMLGMRGATQNYWDEVENIIREGDDAIIKFLMDNNEEYRNAGKLQAEAFVDEWRKILEDLKAMYRDTTRVGIEEFNKLQSAKGVPGTGSTGGGTGAGSNPKPPTERYGLFSNGVRTAGPFSTLAEAQAALDRLRKKAEDNVYNAAALVRVAYTEQERAQADSAYRIAINGRNLARMTGIQAYSTGGLNDYTGLAMLHGTPQRPEAVLNADQTRIFQEFVASMTRLSIGGIPSIGSKNFDRAGDSFNIDRIIIEVDKLENDQDLEELAEKVAKVFQRASTIKSGLPVGTIRF